MWYLPSGCHAFSWTLYIYLYIYIYIRTRGILISIVLVGVWLASLAKYFLQYAIHGTWTMLQYSPGVLWFNFNLIAIKESKWRKALKITLKPNPFLEDYCNGVSFNQMESVIERV